MIRGKVSKNPFHHWKLVFLSYSTDETFYKDLTINFSPSHSKPMWFYSPFFLKSIYKGFAVGSTYMAPIYTVSVIATKPLAAVELFPNTRLIMTSDVLIIT